MAKDPAFLFYPADYISGTMGMTLEEKGAYVELLMMQFNRGHMTSHMIGHTVGQLWVKIQDKFIQDEEGNWYNVRLDKEKESRKKFTESRRNNINGNNQHQKTTGHKIGHMTSHMEDVNINEDIILNKELYEKICENILSQKEYWLMIFKITGMPIESAQAKFKTFSYEEGTCGYKTANELKKHFKNWLKQELKKKPENIQPTKFSGKF